MNITLKDGSAKEFQNGESAAEITKQISEGLYRVAVAAKIDGVICDLNTKITKDCKLEIITFNDDEGKDIYRHTASHIMAMAVKSIYPTCSLAIGPAIDSGFYYDFDFKSPVTTADLEKIEKEMSKIIAADFTVERFVYTRKKALSLMKGETYKIQLINDLPEDAELSFYKIGDFIDLCLGPHLPSTGRVKAFKLTQVAGAYWRGSEKNKMLTRIYGTAFDKKSTLDEYLKNLEEAKKRDHNKIGRELSIFMTDENVGQGLPLLMPHGAKIIQILQRTVEDEEEKRGYVLTKTPLLAKSDLYKMSGHWSHYKDKMFILGDEKTDEDVYALRPMTCPFQFTIYKNGLKSYRDLPVRYGETATLFRKEASGEMHGLIRVRQFTISEGHIVCTENQIEQEFKGVLDLVYYFLNCLGLREDVTFRFSRRDKNDKKKFIDNDAAWDNTETLMKGILDRLIGKYDEAIGDAAFYGPKLDIQTKNVYGKEDTIITIQIDFSLAERFDMYYVDADGSKRRPYIIHRTSIGCYERTLAMLIEKYAGALPFWLSPVQIKVLSITERAAEYATELKNKLREFSLRAEDDNRNEKIGYKIREAQLAKIPYMLVVGDKEKENGTVSVRSRSGEDLGAMPFDEFVKNAAVENAARKR